MTANKQILSPRVRRPDRMEPLRWVQPSTRSLLDVGCNVGELLAAVHAAYPEVQLCGCDVNHEALVKARREIPTADIRESGADKLPFEDESFDCVTCIEVLEHVPAAGWSAALLEMQRVLISGGRLILRTPHAGAFGWLDSNNMRFRFPRLYRWLLRSGASGKWVRWEFGIRRVALPLSPR